MKDEMIYCIKTKDGKIKKTATLGEMAGLFFLITIGLPLLWISYIIDFLGRIITDEKKYLWMRSEDYYKTKLKEFKVDKK